jgi:branched-chain amino acid transport system ATP-binding protein
VAVSALSVTNLSRSFGGVRALSDVSFEVEAHERRLIIGPNGAGKTTLFNLLSGAATVSTGQINLFGHDITYMQPYERARMGLSRTFQITNLFPRLTVLQNVVLALQSIEGGAWNLLRAIATNWQLYDEANSLLTGAGLAQLANIAARNISYGEQRQLDLLLALAVRPKILLLDEPTAGLSAAEVVRIVAILRDLPKDVTVLMIEHDMDVAFSLADRITVLHLGRVIAEGDVAAIRANPQVTEIYLGAE